MGFRVWGLGFGVGGWGLGFRVSGGQGFGALGFGALGLEFRVWGLGVWGFGGRRLGFRVWGGRGGAGGLGERLGGVQGFGFGV